MTGAPRGERALRIAGVEILPGGRLVEAMVPGILSPFVFERDGGVRPSASLLWEGLPATEGNPFGALPPGDWTDSVRAESGLWFRRGDALCRETADLSSWHAWGPRIVPHEDGGSDGKPWLMLAVWGLVAKSGGAFLHGAIGVLGGKYFLLLGDSRAGKSTLSRLVVSAGGSSLTDENPFVTPDGEGEGLVVHGSPWPGLRGADVPLHGRLSAVFFLRHEKENVLRRMSPPEAGRRLLGNARFFAYEPAFTPLTVSLLDRMATSVPVFDFGFVPTEEAVSCLASVL